MQKACGKYSTGKTKDIPWNEQLIKAAMEQHMQSRVVWILDITIVVPLFGKARKRGYNVIQKVCIANMSSILVYIEFAGKESKAATKHKKRKEQSIKALVCSIQHPGVI